MFQAIRRFFRGRNPGKQLLKVPLNQPFAWQKGVWIEATEATIVTLPGALVGDDEVFGSIIELSSDRVQVGFTPSADGSQIVAIQLRLSPGQSACLRRSSEALIQAEHGGETSIYVTLPADG